MYISMLSTGLEEITLESDAFNTSNLFWSKLSPRRLRENQHKYRNLFFGVLCGFYRMFTLENSLDSACVDIYQLSSPSPARQLFKAFKIRGRWCVSNFSWCCLAASDFLHFIGMGL